MSMERKRIGHIANIYALDGGLKVVLTTSYPEQRYKVGNKVLIKQGNTDNYLSFTIKKTLEKNGNVYIVYLKEITDVNQASKYINADLYMDVEKVSENSFYFDELINMNINAFSDNNKSLTSVSKVVDSPNSPYLITKEGQYLPFVIDIFVSKIDLENKIIYLTKLGEEIIVSSLKV